MPLHRLLVALDSVGLDPLGHDRPESVYAESRFLFPPGRCDVSLPVAVESWRGALVATDVTEGCEQGGIECAITYTSIFSGESAVRRHGLMRGLGLSDRSLEEMIERRNLFRQFERPCLANAIFPFHPEFLGSSYVSDLVPAVTREAVEQTLTFQGRPVAFRGTQKNGFAELFTLAEINQNIFVHAARQAGMRLRTWADVRAGAALTSSMTHELESGFNLSVFDQPPLSPRTPEQAAHILVELVRAHDFTFYKYQLAEGARSFRSAARNRSIVAKTARAWPICPVWLMRSEATVIVTSDHGHLEQLDNSRGHPKSKVPTWYFGPRAEALTTDLARPEGIFRVLCGRESEQSEFPRERV
ncbi:MAG: hypothetical protein ACT4QC_09640 [Planctomycetaceae bacterium]